ncbi:hypothetical protein H6P81_004711 [Aristolochia fimbriata]|uniref:Uncharacterized protein n=1 Tax=Aristolochia fimbriata TaxID=158543 RepID=A0AAV7ESI1_ARIFI|nr:hypothetical protein H6P81_004711 [Aristolochia fimbriata]
MCPRQGLIYPLRSVTFMHLLIWAILLLSAWSLSAANDSTSGEQSLHTYAVGCPPPPVKKSPNAPSVSTPPSVPYPYPYYYFYSAGSPSIPLPSLESMIIFGFFTPALILLLAAK